MAAICILLESLEMTSPVDQSMWFCVLWLGSCVSKDQMIRHRLSGLHQRVRRSCDCDGDTSFHLSLSHRTYIHHGLWYLLTFSQHAHKKGKGSHTVVVFIRPPGCVQVQPDRLINKSQPSPSRQGSMSHHCFVLIIRAVRERRELVSVPLPTHTHS